jgi:hypothetical protein
VIVAVAIPVIVAVAIPMVLAVRLMTLVVMAFVTGSVRVTVVVLRVQLGAHQDLP